MALRVESLRSFVALADAGSMTVAAASLHISQPALSRQIAVLEEEMGKQLYRREGGAIRLTREGRILYDYAQSVVELTERARHDIAEAEGSISGLVYIGYGETEALVVLSEAVKRVRAQHPNVGFHLVSGDVGDIIDQINCGALDFMIECGIKQRRRFNTIELPGHDTWAAIMHKDHPLARKQSICPSDLVGVSILVARQAWANDVMRRWMGDSYNSANVAATVNLGTSALALVEAGVGVALGYQELIESLVGDRLAYVPLDPPIHDKRGLVWRKDHLLSPAADVFLQEVCNLPEQA